MPSFTEDTITFNATLSDENANSYCSLAFADDYFAKLPKASTNQKSLYWASLLQAEKENLLVSACWTIEQLRFTVKIDMPGGYADNIHLRYDSLNHMNYYVANTPDGVPVRYNPFQALQFPRTRDIKTDGSTYIPERVLISQCEQAYYLAKLDTSSMELIEQGVTSDLFKGDIEVAQRFSGNYTNLAPHVKRWLAPYRLNKVKKFERG